MKTNLLIIFISCIWSFSYAQNKHDYLWLLGRGGEYVDTSFGGTNIDFNENPIELYRIERDITFELNSSSFCDKEGDLLLYTDGCYVFNGDNELIENGDEINAGTIHRSYCDIDISYPSGYANTLILPDPSNEDHFYIIHQRIVQFWPDEFSRVHYSKVDMSANNGKGKLIEANIQVMPDSVYLGEMAAVRHANGKDWWIVAPEDSTNVYNFLLLDSTGVHKHHDQVLGQKVGYYGTGSGQCKFSPDGKWFARWNQKQQLLIGDFNRESGRVENSKQYFPIDTANYGGLEFSPNSRFLYFTNITELFQLDLSEQDLLGSMELVAEYDGFVDFLPLYFGRLQLTPDCRIFINGPGGHRFWHIIEHPNEKGAACLVRQHALALPTYTFNTMPYFPNFNLGPVGDEGYPCDSTRVSANSEIYPILENTGWLYPNPAREKVQIKPGLFVKPVHLRIFDTQGKLQLENAGFEPNSSLDISTLPSGLYFFMVNDENGKSWAERLVVE